MNKADMISRAAAIEAMRECWRRVNQFAKPFEANRIMDCIKAVKEVPAVDAAPVVRCRDCKYSDVIYDTTSDTMPLKCLNIRYGGVQPDWYCEHGERRDSE